MKKINVLSLFILLSFAQMYASASVNGANSNPQLLFVLAAQAANVLDEQSISDSEDVVAAGIIQSMNKFISIDKNLQKQLQAAQAGTFFNGKPINAADLEKADNDLQNAINGYNSNLKKLRGKGGAAAGANKSKIDKETKNRNAKQAQLDANKVTLQSNATAQGKIASLNTTIQQNALAFEQALETYISRLGLSYAKSGSVYGSTTIIASKDNANEPITPKEYAQLIKTLQAAASEFGSNVTITLALQDGSKIKASISDVVSYMNNMSPSSASYLTFTNVGLGAVAAVAAAIGANALVNYSQGNALIDTTNLQNLGNAAGQAISNAQSAATDAYNSYATSSSYTPSDVEMKNLKITLDDAFGQS